MAITTIADNFTMPLEEIKNYLEVDADETSNDLLIQLLFDAAKEDADKYCQNDFGITLGGSGSGDGSAKIPNGVKLWVLQRVKRNFERRPEGLNAENITGMGSITWGDPDLSGLEGHRSVKRGTAREPQHVTLVSLLSNGSLTDINDWINGE